MSGGTAFFSLVQTFRQRMRKRSGSSIPSLPKKINMLVFLICFVFFFFLPAIDISVDFITQEACVSGLDLSQTEARDGFMQTGTPKMLCCTMAVHE